MKVEIKKSGNSAALRIPADVLRSLGLSIGDEMTLDVTDTKMIFKKMKNPREGWFDNLGKEAAKQEAENMEHDFGGIQDDSLDEWQNGDSW